MRNNKKVLKKRKKCFIISRVPREILYREACRNYLFQKRWPNGFICPKCDNTSYYELEDKIHYQCTQCKRQTSVTAGTYA